MVLRSTMGQCEVQVDDVIQEVFPFMQLTHLVLAGFILQILPCSFCSKSSVSCSPGCQNEEVVYQEAGKARHLHTTQSLLYENLFKKKKISLGKKPS